MVCYSFVAFKDTFTTRASWSRLNRRAITGSRFVDARSATRLAHSCAYAEVSRYTHNKAVCYQYIYSFSQLLSILWQIHILECDLHHSQDCQEHTYIHQVWFLPFTLGLFSLVWQVPQPCVLMGVAPPHSSASVLWTLNCVLFHWTFQHHTSLPTSKYHIHGCRGTRPFLC